MSQSQSSVYLYSTKDQGQFLRKMQINNLLKGRRRFEELSAAIEPENKNALRTQYFAKTRAHADCMLLMTHAQRYRIDIFGANFHIQKFQGR